MMHEHSSKSGLFLMELIIVILFFSLTSAITVQIFVKSHRINEHSVAITHCSILFQNMAELFRSYDGDFNLTKEALSEEITLSDETSFSIYYTTDWDFSQHSLSDGYLIHGVYSFDQDIACLQLTASDLHTKETIMTLSIDQYQAKEVMP